MTLQFQPGSLVQARGREWVVLPDSRTDLLRLRPLGGSDEDATSIYLPLEAQPPRHATFPSPDPAKAGSYGAGLLLRDALMLKLRAGAGPFRSFGNLAVEPRAYQLVPLMMALRQQTVRLLIADDVGVGKTIEGALIARELLDRGEIKRLAVICPPHLCEQWQEELEEKFGIQSVVVRTGSASRLERGIPAGQSIFDVYPFTVVSLDFIKKERRIDEFLRACPEFVIVEEAHTCVGTGGASRHQRYNLLRGLADDAERHMVFLTATPHSGDETAFYNLLGLLRPEFQGIGQLQGKAKEQLRQELSVHFVQRRRPDIAEWQDSTVFPDRLSKEATYKLSGEWGRLFDDVLGYARGMFEEGLRLGRLQQRMNWWAALALLRCISSSPAAATAALTTRLRSVSGASEAESLREIEQLGSETVLDGEGDDLLTLDDAAPAALSERAGDAETAILHDLVAQAQSLRGARQDPKLAALLKEVEALVSEGFAPVIFCRYIPTAHYLAAELAERYQKKGLEVVCVTGELTPEERQERIEQMREHERRILVATDCLSEGVNLQEFFTAVVHYDLSWNPTRHEQREGRVDRFGQSAKQVRAVMLYGENNPVDGAVLKVILRKAEQIRKELGVTVPMPADTGKIMDAVMKAVLLRKGGLSEHVNQMSFDFGAAGRELEEGWESARETASRSRTIFAQQRLRPDEVLPEWRKAIQVLGGTDDVQRFVLTAAQRLGAPLEATGKGFRLPVDHFPLGLRDRLGAIGWRGTVRIAFDYPLPAGAHHVHRTHPLVLALAEHVAEIALEGEDAKIAARGGAIFTDQVKERTTLYLLRLRSQLSVRYRSIDRVLLSEECRTLVARGSGAEGLDAAATRDLMDLTPTRNMDPAMRERLVQEAVAALPELEEQFTEVAGQRAEELLTDHRRVRAASEAKGFRYDVRPCLPVDVIGVYVMLPVVSF